MLCHMAARIQLDVKEVISKYKELGSTKKVASIFGVSSPTIERRLRENGIGKPVLYAKSRFSKEDLPKYKEWCRKVFELDNFRCQVCGSNGKITAHHILTWHNHPNMRFNVNNGITLCVLCHYVTYGHEDGYVELFTDLLYLQRNTIVDMRYEKEQPPIRKICIYCNTEKDIQDFYPNKLNKFGRSNSCKECNKQKSYNAFKNNPDRIEKSKQWEKDHKDERSLYHTLRGFNTMLLSGRIPNYTELRVKHGLVPKDRSKWPTEEIRRLADEKQPFKC